MLELASLFGGGVFGALLKLMRMSQEHRQQMEIVRQNLSEYEAKMITAARTQGGQVFHLTQTIVIIVSVLSVMVLPKIVPLFWPEIPVYVSEDTASGGFHFIIQWVPPTDGIKWTRLSGMVITPTDRAMMMAIVGFLFGASGVSSTRR